MMTAKEEIDAANATKNFPRWAQSCPKSFEEMRQSIARGAIVLAQLPMDPKCKAAMTVVLGDIAAVCWAAGIKSVRESNGATAQQEGMG